MVMVSGFADIKKPHVTGVAFKSEKVELLNYLDQFKGEERDREHQRLAQLIYIKEDLASLLSHMPYNPPEGSKILIKQQGKLTLTPCLFVKGNEDQIDLKTVQGEYLRLNWSDIPSETILVLMEFYLKMKMSNIKLQQSDKKTLAELKMDLADFSMRMALFADWNGLKEKSLEYSKLATRYEPEYRQYTEAFISH